MSKLQVGDVFAVNAGMAIYASLPNKFIYANRYEGSPDGDTLSKTNIKVGEVRQSKPNPVLAITKRTGRYDTSIFVGEYVVLATAMNGGGTAHGPHDVYPDGWNVRARQLCPDGSYDPEGREISFYQSGAFTAVNTDVPVIAKMRQTFVREVA